MRIPIGLFLAGIATAAVALALDSFFVLVGSVALVGGSAVGFFAQGWRAAARAEAQASYVAVLGGSIVAALLGVASIVIGVRGDAPGLALLGIAVIFADLVGVLAVALRTAQRGA